MDGEFRFFTLILTFPNRSELSARFVLFVILVLVCSIVVFLSGLLVGSVKITLSELLQVFTHASTEDQVREIVFQIRLPRVILAFLVGGGLALCGYLMQIMVNNPLADPYILGTASGASLGVNIAYLGVFPIWIYSLIPTSLFAFTGALLVTLLAVSIGYSNNSIDPSRLLLGGIALSSISLAFTTLLIYASPSQNHLKNLIYWSFGSFDHASWKLIPLPFVVLSLSLVLFSFLSKELNVLLLGEMRAVSLGVSSLRLRWVILAGTSLVTAVSVAVAGPIGFVGLVVPHFVRGVLGATGRFNLAASVLCGGLFLIVCDVIARFLFPVSALPVGIVSSFLGIPFFVYLLSRKNYRFS